MVIYITGAVCAAYIGLPFIRGIIYLHKSKSQRSSEKCADIN